MAVNIEELVGRVRYLVVIVATIEPDRARAELDSLITTHGHALIAAIRTAVAPATYPGLTSEQDTTASRGAADDLEQTDAGRHAREGPPRRWVRGP